MLSLIVNLGAFKQFQNPKYIFMPTLSDMLENLFFSHRRFQCYFMNIHKKISEKYSPLYVLISFQNYFGFFELRYFVIYDERF
jgi:hypothetical protein